MAYKMAMRLIQTGRTANIVDKLNAWLYNDQITAEQYNELMAMLPVQEA